MKKLSFAQYCVLGAAGFGALLGLVTPACASTPPVQFFYIPFPENQFLATLQAIESGGPSVPPSNPMQTYISIAAVANGTVIYYDHWEDGYETDISNPVQLTTRVWGDGNTGNGAPPECPVISSTRAR